MYWKGIGRSKWRGKVEIKKYVLVLFIDGDS